MSFAISENLPIFAALQKRLTPMELYISSIKEYLQGEDIVNIIIDNLHLIHENPDSRDYVINQIGDFLKTLREDLTILVETEYVDKVYRDSYYTLYSTKLRGYHRNCVRISFFTPEFNESTPLTVENIDSIKHAYSGFLVVRPLAECCIGRNVISPSAKKSTYPDMAICKAQIASTCMGIKMQATGFPHSSQDGEMMSCAETTVWAILEYFGNKYSDYHPIMPSDILAALKPFAYERQLPSGGLSFEQISIALKSQGFGCKVYEQSNPMFQELFTCYIESGIPLAVCIQTAEFGHAVVCIGRNQTDRRIIESKGTYPVLGKGYYYVWNKSIDNFIFNDDNLPCYQPTTFQKPTAYYGSTEWDSGEITHFIVPLHPKVYLDAELAINASNYFVIHKLKAPSHSVIRTFLASNRTYREYIMKNKDMDETAKQIYLQIDMPKFVWVTEIADKTSFYANKVNGLVLLDATGSNIDNEGYSSLLFYQINGTGTFFNKEIRWFENIPISLPTHFEAFNENLK